MKSEKDKMLSGAYYNAMDEALVLERDQAKDLTYEYNRLRPSERAKGQEIMGRLIKARGTFHIEAPFYCDYGYNIEVGDGFYANHGCTILDVNRVTIGSNVLLGPHVQIYTATHPVDPAERLAGKEYAKAIEIGDNVWIGGGSIICPGVRIGDNAVVGAGSVITKDIPENTIAAGNPCRVIKGIPPIAETGQD